MAASVENSLAIEVSVVLGLPVSFSHADRQTSIRAASVCSAMSVSIFWTSWELASGRPNWIRSLEYLTDASSDPWQMPTHPDATLNRPESSALIATLNPSPTWPSIDSSEAWTSSSEIAAVSEPRRPSLWWIGWG